MHHLDSMISAALPPRPPEDAPYGEDSSSDSVDETFAPVSIHRRYDTSPGESRGKLAVTNVVRALVFLSCVAGAFFLGLMLLRRLLNNPSPMSEDTPISDIWSNPDEGNTAVTDIAETRDPSLVNSLWARDAKTLYVWSDVPASTPPAMLVSVAQRTLVRPLTVLEKLIYAVAPVPPLPEFTFTSTTTAKALRSPRVPKRFRVETLATVPPWRQLIRNDDGRADRLLDFCLLHGFQRIFLFIGSAEWESASLYSQGMMPEDEALAALIRAFALYGVEVEGLAYLFDDPNASSELSTMAAELALAVASFNNRHPDARLAGLHLDQEPNRASVYPALLAALGAAHTVAQESGFRLSTTVKPSWVTEEVDGSPMFWEVSKRVDAMTLMAYRRSASAVRALATPVMTRLGEAGREGVLDVAIETGWVAAEACCSFYDDISACPGCFLGDGYAAVSEELNAEALSVRSSTGTNPMGVTVVHDYGQLYSSLYGLRPASDDRRLTDYYAGRTS
jgi:hypothetical protein